MKITITLDDDDRVQCPETPWTANVVGGDEDAGIGVTPEAAVADLLSGLTKDDEESAEASNQWPRSDAAVAWGIAAMEARG